MENTFATHAEVLAEFKNILRNSKGVWAFISFTYNGKFFHVKMFNKYIQIFKVGEIHFPYAETEFDTNKALLAQVEKALEWAEEE